MRFLQRSWIMAGAALLGAGLALPAYSALAQSGSSSSAADFPDLVPVAVWTGVVAIVALLITSVGYLYRRQRGLDHPLHAPPPGVDSGHGHGTEDLLEDTAGHAVTPHEALEHSITGASDAVEQAAVAHDTGH